MLALAVRGAGTGGRGLGAHGAGSPDTEGETGVHLLRLVRKRETET